MKKTTPVAESFVQPTVALSESITSPALIQATPAIEAHQTVATNAQKANTASNHGLGKKNCTKKSI